ncbi:filamin A-interacting protein 1-like isoform X2 [Mercenaria mercenaria]|uniref:filamin A-interacting protein 1-like isoform X2 n=1 Tax=Mercenaria mercenaria TaxID=6596 RepID=UPI00234ED028|nr:filamin A-interacting protein 1-like isoform X2 [Mercenaria mercenaria]
MGGAQSTQKMATEDILRFLEEEVKTWGDSIKNLRESWKNKESWVPAYLRKQIEETETRWLNIKSITTKLEEKNARIKYPETAMQYACCCQEIQRKTDAEMNQLKKENETLLRNKEETEFKLKKLKEIATEQQYKLFPSKLHTEGNVKTGNTASKDRLRRADEYRTLGQDEFLKRMMNLEDEFEEEKAQLQTEKEILAAQKNSLEERVEHLEKTNSDLQERNRGGLDKTDRLEAENAKQQEKETLQQSQQIKEDKECQTEEEIEETFRKAKDELKEKYLHEQSKNEELIKENNRLIECNTRLSKEKSEMLARNKSSSEQTAKGETERQKQHNEEPLKKQSQQVKATQGKQTGRDNPIESLRKKCQKMEKDNLELLDQREMLKAQNDSLQTYANQLKEEKDELLLRLSKFAGDKLVDNNPAITDLSDPNRPTKLGEFYSEIYDNEWTNAFEALVHAGYDEVKTIETLRLTLQNVMQFCERKSELLLQKVSDAVNLLFEEYRQTVLEMRMPSHLTMPKQQARDVGQFLRREKSSLQDIKLQRRWEPDSDTNADSVKTSSEKILKDEHSKLNADTKLKQLRKDMASSMVPIVQKAYIEASWTNRCIEELKPYILKCLYLGWMMVVQSPPLVLHEFPTEKEIKFDKNMYKEYTASGPLVSYVVWPALLLEENGPVVCKGVAEGQKP